MLFEVTYRVWGRLLTETINAASDKAAEAEVNRTMFAPDAKFLSVKPVITKGETDATDGRTC